MVWYYIIVKIRYFMLKTLHNKKVSCVCIVFLQKRKKCIRIKNKICILLKCKKKSTKNFLYILN